MSKIKTRENAKDIKVFDKASTVSDRMRETFIRTKDSVRNLSDDGQVSPTEYADDKISYAAEDAVETTGRTARRGAKKTVDKVDEARKKAKEIKKELDKKNDKPNDTPDGKEPSKDRGSTKNTSDKTSKKKNGKKPDVKESVDPKKKSIKTKDGKKRTIKQTKKSTQKATVKTQKATVKASQKSVKTAQKTAKTTIKTAEKTAKAAKQAAKATAKAAKAAAQAARAAAKAAVTAAKVAVKAIVAAVKAAIAAIKGLVALIAAGGWIAVIVIVVICLIALIVGSVYGIFFSGEEEDTITMQTVIQEINTDYESQIQTIKDNTTYDVLEMNGSMAVWKEVLAVYTVKVVTDPDNPQEVATMDEGKKATLTEIFWEMNTISSSTETKKETISIESADAEGNIVVTTQTVTRTYLYITVAHLTSSDMASRYGFSAEQTNQLNTLLDEVNNDLWSAVLTGITYSDDAIVAVAQMQIGNVGGQPYWSWYGFGSRVEWCACFVSWCANECNYIENGIIPKFASCDIGMTWFKDRGQWKDNTYEPTPGTIIFFDWADMGQPGSADHVGIVKKVENGIVYTIEGNSGDTCCENQYAVGYSEILGYGIPAY